VDHPAAAQVRVNASSFEISFGPVGKLSIDLVEPPADPEPWLAERFRTFAGRPPAETGRLDRPRPCLRAMVDGEEGRDEVYLIEDARGERAALLSFSLPGGDPIIRERWVESAISSFRFR
jgi:hypothetical protein